MEIVQNIVEGVNKRRKRGKIRKYVKRHGFLKGEKMRNMYSVTIFNYETYSKEA